MKVFLYMRVSSEEQVKHGYSLDAQEEALKDFCEKNNHVIVGSYKDEGISARKPYTKRPAMVQLLNDLESIHPDIVLFTKLDRWFRNIREYYKVQDILDRNKVYWKAINEEYDTSTASGRLYVNIKLSIAQDEADRTSERIKDVQSQLVSQGKVLGGNIAFGYAIKDKRVVFGDNIHIVKEAVEFYLIHQSAHATARHLNDKYGTKFTTTKLLNLLKNPLLKGEYRGNTAYCEALIDSDTWDRLQDVIKKNIRHASHKRYFYFSGLIKCPLCGCTYGGFTGNGYKHYRCTRHDFNLCSMRKTINEKKMEKWMLEHVADDFEVEMKSRPKRKTENPKKYREQLKRLNDMYLLGTITNTEYKEKASELQKKIAELSKVPEVRESVFNGSWKEVYEMLDDEHKRSFWRGIVKQIVIDQNCQPVKIEFI